MLLVLDPVGGARRRLNLPKRIADTTTVIRAEAEGNSAPSGPRVTDVRGL